MDKLLVAYQFGLLNRKSQQVLVRLCKENGFALTNAELILLMQLYREEGCMQDALADRLCVDRAVVTRIVQSLERKGFVFRERDGADGRKKHVHLTKEAKAREPFFHKIMFRWVEYLGEGLASEDIRTLARLLDVMVARAGKADTAVL